MSAKTTNSLLGRWIEMPPCSFCGRKVLPASIAKSERRHPVCDKCRQVLDEYLESRVQESLPEQLKELLEEGDYKLAFEEKWDTVIADTIKTEVSGAIEDLVKEQVAAALKGGLATLVSGARPLSRGRKGGQ